MHTRETEKNALITRRITILLDCSLHILKDTFVFELKCSAAGGRLEPDPTAARRAAGERVTSASRVVVTRSDSATLAAMTRWHGPGPVTTRMTPSQIPPGGRPGAESRRGHCARASKVESH